jgi:hypothetical protein
MGTREMWSDDVDWVHLDEGSIGGGQLNFAFHKNMIIC